MRTPIQELAEALAQLNDAPRFRVYVRTLYDAREATMVRLIDVNTPSAAVESLRGELRAYDTLLKALKRGGVSYVEASISGPPGEGG